MNINSVKNNLFNTLFSSFQLIEIDENTIEIVTPYNDLLGDGISMNLRKDPDSLNLILTDDGFTLWNLEQFGLTLTNKQSFRNKLMHSILSSNKAYLTKNDEIIIETSLSDIGQSIIDMSDTLMKVSNLISLNKQNVTNIFYEDVDTYFKSNRDIYSYQKGLSLNGVSGVAHKLDYIFTKNNQFKMVKLYSSINKNTYDAILGILTDTEANRYDSFGENNSLNIVYDSSNDVNSKFKDGLKKHGVTLIDFYKKDQVQQAFAK